MSKKFKYLQDSLTKEGFDFTVYYGSTTLRLTGGKFVKVSTEGDYKVSYKKDMISFGSFVGLVDYLKHN